MNTPNRYLIYLIYFLLTIPAVIILFKFIEPRKLASLFAATIFISCSLLPIWGELKNKTKSSFVFWSAIGFLVLFSAPMIIVRVINYDVDFSSISFGPLSGPEFHKYSNYGFIILFCSTIVDFVQKKLLLKTKY
ncbi:MAG: hypothetical protein B7Y39_09075 [Bdellovibrio sp. 28-41-41]|nr:MAG: hypothetical protein B7Y39_09075 [Bdellovibrio sp. 28-41-41]